MTADEVLIELEILFIITKVGETYYITEKYKTLDEKIDFIEEKIADKEKLATYKNILAAVDKPSTWPDTIIKAKGRYKVIAFMDACEIPATAGPTRYRIRGFNKDVERFMDKLIMNKDVDPILIIEAVKRYYTLSEMPKGFSKFALEGDIMDVYAEFIEVNPLNNPEFLDPLNKPNSTWG